MAAQPHQQPLQQHRSQEVVEDGETARGTVTVGAGALDSAEVVAVARHGAPVDLGADAVAAMKSTRAVIDALAEDPMPHYGVSTGFGALATTQVPVERRVQLQRSLVRSHAASSGAPMAVEVVRALMLNRLATMATGRTGVRPEIARRYAALLNAGITPVVGEHGSLGCSGDLAPLSHCALAVMGEGEVFDASGRRREAADALAAAGIEPVELVEKEGLALINGTDGMLGMLLMALADLERLACTADIAAALSIEALHGTDAVFAEDLHQLRPQPGQGESAANLRRMLADSALIQDAKHNGHRHTRVQDAYSMRCAPQVHGAVRATMAHARGVAEHELASAVDNPVVTVDGRVESNGNFHGAPVGYVLDFLAIAAADCASMAERRTDRMLDKNRSHGLPPFLADDPGVDSGHMIAQYTQAGIVSEMKRLAAPASVDSIPSSAMQEDHVSMGWSAGLKLRRAVEGLEQVLAIELLTAARGVDMREQIEGLGSGRSSTALGSVRAVLRERVAGPDADRHLAPEIAEAVELVRSGAVVAAAEQRLDAPLA
ncbi:histidine ammonia-lyase [Nesterenkonia sp. F]|uniref:histidine ammonia-lyase n=1 Tax=Nesterenkonia sp. F TaxID=795955 RepID=UPI000255C869|nr:histidine ammonia-lyase [Nesterenkonia sp. F]